MASIKRFTLFLSLALISNLSFGASIEATPGTYELVEGSSMQFDGKPQKGNEVPSSYHWEIFSGEGAELSEPSSPKITFYAPTIEEETRSFTLKLTLSYESGKTSSAQIRVRVHRKSQVVEPRSSPWTDTGIGFGFGYMWGGWWHYPPIVIIPCPPPEIIWLPEDIIPIVVPMEEDPSHGEWLENNPSYETLYKAEPDSEPLRDNTDSNDNEITDTEINPVEIIPSVTETHIEAESQAEIITEEPSFRESYDDAEIAIDSFDDFDF